MTTGTFVFSFAQISKVDKDEPWISENFTHVTNTGAQIDLAQNTVEVSLFRVDEFVELDEKLPEDTM